MPYDLDSIGRYQIKGVLGKGAAGIVFKAYDPVLQRTVAIKIPKESDSAITNNPKTGQDFYSEAVMGGQLQHENIVSIYDVGRDNNIDYLVMEYVDGASLKHHLKHNKPLTIEYVTESIYRLCMALDYIHYNKIVHRDIKPDNVMVNTDNDIVKLMDFSCASRTSEMASDKTGSAPYMAPEIHDSGNIIGIQSDIFSLGALMYELLTGEMAFPGEDALSCVYKVINEEPKSAIELRKELPQELNEILIKAMQKNPDMRFQTVLEFAEALQHYKQKNNTDKNLKAVKEDQYLVFRKDVFFKNFSPDQVKELMDAGEVQLFNDKQMILREGKENNTFYLVIQGDVQVLKGRTLIRNLTEGECFGEMSYLTKDKTTASIRANGEVMVWSVSPGLIGDLSCKSQLGFQNAFIEMIVQRLTNSTEHTARLQKLLYQANQTKKK